MQVLEAVRRDFESCVWMTYRRDFPPIGARRGRPLPASQHLVSCYMCLHIAHMSVLRRAPQASPG